LFIFSPFLADKTARERVPCLSALLIFGEIFTETGFVRTAEQSRGPAESGPERFLSAEDSGGISCW